MPDSSVPFGYKDVTPTEKTAQVQAVFTDVAANYDFMNDLMSLGQHRRWKDYFVSRLPLRPAMQVLDMATGTADIARRIAAACPDVSLTLCDPNPAMMARGKKNFPHPANWIIADAASIPLPDNSQDLYTISFGLRNVTYLKQSLQEAFRVLKPGRQYWCMEFSQVALPFFQEAYAAYAHTLIPILGKIVAGNREAYKYLIESIERFPNQTRLQSMLEGVGFQYCRYENLVGGLVAIHTGWKI